MKLPAIPNPLDVAAELVALLPRATALLTGAEGIVRDVGGLLRRIEETRARADVVVERVDVTRATADALVGQMAGPLERLVALLDALEPPLTTLQPTLERLAETTDPTEVDALVTLIDHLPDLTVRFEKDLVPVLESLQTVAPDLHDLLDISRELNEMMARLPGLGRIKRRVEEEQAAEGRG